MPKILIIDSSKYVTGALKSIAAAAGALNESASFYWALDEALETKERDALLPGAPVRTFAFQDIRKSIPSLARYVPRLVRNVMAINKWIKENSIQLVHVNDCTNLVGIGIKKLNPRVKLVYHVRLLRGSYMGPAFPVLVGLVDRYADAIICCSDTVAADVGHTLTVQHRVYDADSFAGDGPSAEVRRQVRNLIYIANVLPGKGQDHAVRAFALLANEFPDMRLRFVGKFGHNAKSATFKKMLDQMVSGHRLAQRVTFAGFRSDIQSELQNADISLVLSESESFSLVCLESLRAGVPVVAAACGGPSEIIENMESGCLVTNRDPVAAADAVRRLASDEGLRRRLAKNGYESARSRFNIARTSKELGDIYEALLADGSDEKGRSGTQSRLDG